MSYVCELSVRVDHTDEISQVGEGRGAPLLLRGGV